MKHKICISIDEETLLKVKQAIKNQIFRNTSHAFEAAMNKVIRE